MSFVSVSAQKLTVDWVFLKLNIDNKYLANTPQSLRLCFGVQNFLFNIDFRANEQYNTNTTILFVWFNFCSKIILVFHISIGFGI